MFRTTILLALLCLILIGPASTRAADGRPAAPPDRQEPSIHVELLAVAAAPLNEMGWWDADGCNLEQIPKAKALKPPGAVKDLEPGQIARYVCLTADVPTGATVELSLPGQKYSIRLPEKLDDRDWDDVKKEAEARGQPFGPEEFETVQYSLGGLIVCDRTQRQTYAEIHVTQGEWDAITRRPSEPDDENWVTFDLENLRDPAGRPIDVFNDRAEFQIEAEDADGERHRSALNAVARNQDGSVRSVQASFKLPGKTIVAYHLLSRMRTSFRIDNIPLYPVDIPASQQIRSRGGVFVGDRDLLIGVEKNTQPSDLDWMNCEDDDLAFLAECDTLRRVHIASDAITNEAAERIADAQQLRHIRLTGNQLTADSLASLSQSQAEIIELTGKGLKDIPSEVFEQLVKSKKLRELRLWDTVLTDDNLQVLSGVPSLRVLCGNGEQLTPAGLKQLAKLTALQELRLSGANWTDESLAAIRPLTSLRRMDLSKSDITDDGLTELAILTSLEWIDLRHTNVTNAGIAELATLDDLKRLDLRGTRCNRGSWNALSQSFPDIRMKLPPAPGKQVEMSVTVRDHTNQPVPNANVWLFTAEHFFARRNRTGKPFPAPPLLGQSETDENGQAAISFDTADGKSFYAVWAVDPEGRLAVETFSGYRLKQHLTTSLQLTDKQTTMRVVDAQGKPVPGVQVVPSEIPQEVPQTLYSSIGQTTDQAGRVTFPGLALDTIQKLYFQSEQIGEQSTGRIRTVDLSGEVSIQLSPTGTLSGSFHGGSPESYGQLRGTIYVETFRSKDSTADLTARYSWAPLEVDANGDFHIEQLGHGYANFADETTTGPFRVQWEPAEILPRDLTIVESDLQRVVPVVGTLRLIDDWRSAEELPVRLQGGGRRGNRAWSREVETDDSGRFTQHVLSGELDLYVSRFYLDTYTSIDNWQWRNGYFGGAHLVQATDGEEQRVWYLEPLSLAPVVRKTGTLTDREGQPLNQSVYGFPTEPNEDLNVTNSVGTSARNEGHFEMLYPETHPPVIFRGDDRDYFYTVKQSDPLILVDETKPEQ